MKKIIIVVVIIAVIIAFIYFRKKINNTEFLKTEVGKVNIKINSLQDVLIGLVSGYEADIEMVVKNFSPQKYSFSNVLANLYTKDGAVLAEQQTPINKPTALEPGQSVTIPIKYKLNAGALRDIIVQLGSTDIKKTLESYLNTRLLGADINVKGYVSSGNLKINLDFLTKF